MEKVNIVINGKNLSVDKGITILDAARQNNIYIPTLCFLKGVNKMGACRMCLVEVKGARSLQASCIHPVNEGMEVTTNSPAVAKSRRAILELILSNHNGNCLTCPRTGDCELQALARELNITEIPFEGENILHEIDDRSPSIVRDNNKCVLCRRCVSACHNIQTTAVIQAKNRGFKTNIGCVYDKSLDDVSCIMCGQCIQACPTGALKEKDHVKRVWKAINRKDTVVVFQSAPAVRAALGEEFGLFMGTACTGRMVSSIRALGVDLVFDTNTAADLTIMEEGYELLGRIKNGGLLPLITSCSPGWIKFAEHYYPEILPNVSSCKSPHVMLGAIIKSYFAEKQGIDPKNIYVVSVMPCTAKKYEIQRPEMEVDGIRDVDAVLTTRELAKMIREAHIDFVNMPDGEFDSPMGMASGAGVIFGATGGVTEAALRTVGAVLKGANLTDIEFEEVRGEKGIKEYSVELRGLTIKGAVVSGMGNARALLDEVKAGTKEYHFIEIMGCSGGCVMGGGQPIVKSNVKNSGLDVFATRSKALYSEDRGATVRLSHENPYIKQVYTEFLGQPNSQVAHKYLHTHYEERPLNREDLMERQSVTIVDKLAK